MSDCSDNPIESVRGHWGNLPVDDFTGSESMLAPGLNTYFLLRENRPQC